LGFAIGTHAVRPWQRFWFLLNPHPADELPIFGSPRIWNLVLRVMILEYSTIHVLDRGTANNSHDIYHSPTN